MNNVIKAIREHQRFVVISHIRPDGDAVGSSLAMHRILKSLGKSSTLILRDGVPKRMSFLANSGEVESPSSLKGDWEVAILVDVPTVERSGYDIIENRPAPLIVNVDHHMSNTLFGDVNWIVPEGPATCFMIYELCQALNVQFDAPLASQLFVGIMTDTGYFRFDTVSSEVFAAAAELTRCGADAHDLHRRIFAEKPLAEVKQLGNLLSRIATTADGRVGWIELSKEQHGEEAASQVDLASVFSNLTAAKELEVCFCLSEQSPELTLVELRSKGEFNVSEVAAILGGGGHRNAAGFAFRGTASRARTCLLPLITEALRDFDASWDVDKAPVFLSDSRRSCSLN